MLDQAITAPAVAFCSVPHMLASLWLTLFSTLDTITFGKTLSSTLRLYSNNLVQQNFLACAHISKCMQNLFAEITMIPAEEAIQNTSWHCNSVQIIFISIQNKSNDVLGIIFTSIKYGNGKDLIVSRITPLQHNSPPFQHLLSLFCLVLKCCCSNFNNSFLYSFPLFIQSTVRW